MPSREELTPISMDALDAWASSTRKNPTRSPATDHPHYVQAGIPAAIRRACELRVQGKPFSIPQLWRQLQAHGYRLKESALRTYIRKHLRFDWKRRMWKDDPP